jgi:Fungal Zn(2)-Cys(6) binuclear cluster domain
LPKGRLAHGTVNKWHCPVALSRSTPAESPTVFAFSAWQTENAQAKSHSCEVRTDYLQVMYTYAGLDFADCFCQAMTGVLNAFFRFQKIPAHPTDSSMNTEISRRSACDRCRGQKLRCVRQSPPRSQAGDEPPLVPCDRCLKAGAACINNIDPPRRRLTRGEKILNHPTSSAPSQDRTPHSLLPKASGTYSTGGSSTRPPTGGDGRRSEGSVRFDDTANVE